MSDQKFNLEELLIAHTERIENQYKEIDSRLDEIEKVIIKQEINLKQHMKRSDMLETMVNNMKEQDLKPISKHVNMVEGAIKLLGVISLIVGIAASIFKSLQ